MSETITWEQLEPAAVWRHFLELCKIPRPSHKEEKISQYLKAFGEYLFLPTTMDEVGNVIIKKPATDGMEDRATVILQGHVDMVCEKNQEVTFDFDNDAIQAYIDGDWVTAQGTTLGADNGIGLAIIMAILESDDLVHGPIEALFTVGEEVGLTGATDLKPGMLDGTILLNLDSEKEGEFCIGSAGGVYTNIEIDFQSAPVPEGMTCFKLRVSGLKGGHSGVDIHRNRGNAIKLLNRILWQIARDQGIRIADIFGGALPNAIPREAFSILVVPQDKVAAFLTQANRFQAIIQNELSLSDAGVIVTVDPEESPSALIDQGTQDKLLNALYACPHGVLRMSDAVPELVEASTNLAHIEIKDGKVIVLTMQRSSVDSEQDDAAKQVACAFHFDGATVQSSAPYSGWQPNLDSKILAVAKKCYQDEFGTDPAVRAIHAGLECGLISAVYPALDMISLGPNITGAHSPDEKVEIASVNKLWQYVLILLKNIPGKTAG